MLTGAQRYKQACTKARIESCRNLRLFTQGEIDIIPCSGDAEREYIIKELDRAYHAGFEKAAEIAIRFLLEGK